jgi:hypothetical protein
MTTATRVNGGEVTMIDEEARLCAVLGEAVVEAWGDLPREIQERLFERAVVLGHLSERDEALRQQLARFLHERNPRTAHPGPS